MEWKLYTRNENFREPVESSATYLSRDVALKGAYELFIDPSLHKKVIRIEGPDERRIERDQIEEWCRNHRVGK
jgi:hypothetical protein